MGDIFYNKTVTVFNQYMDEGPTGAVHWLPTVLENVRLIETHGANISKSGIAGADAASLYIKTEDLNYLEPKAWKTLTLEEKKKKFTLAPDSDFFVKGDHSKEDLSQVDFFSYMKKKYDGVYKVTTVDKYELIPHLEVGGK